MTRSRTLLTTSCGALLLAALAAPAAVADDDGRRGSPGRQEVLLVDASCSRMPDPIPEAPLEITLTLTGSGTVTGTGGSLGVRVQGKTGGCKTALDGVPQVITKAGCSSGSLVGTDESASVGGVCEGRRAAVVGSVADIARAFLAL